MAALARWCFRHRRIVVLLWVVALLGLGGASAAVGSDFKDDFKLPNTESKKALDLLKESSPQQSGETDQIVVHAKQGKLTDPAVRGKVEAMFADVSKLAYVKGVGSFYDADAAEQVSKDGTIAFANLQLDPPESGTIPKPDVKRIISAAQSIDSSAIQVELGGMSIANAADQQQSASELIGIVAAAIILFLAFGSIYTMFLPILTAVLALAGTGAMITFLTHAFSVASFAPMLATLIGLGVGVDYALFIVSRHRTNLQQGHTPEESVVTAVDTAGRAVVFAGITVCIGLLGLMLIGVSFLYGPALASVIAVLFTMLAALTFLPAMLGFVGMKALGRKERKRLASEGPRTHDELSPVWYKLARNIEKRPVVWGTLALAAMIALAVPMLDLRLGSTDAGSDPKGSTTRASYDLLAEGFGAGFNGPLMLVGDVHNDADKARFNDLLTTVKDQKDVVVATAPMTSPNGKVMTSQVYPSSSPQDKATTDLISNLRHHVIPGSEKGTSLKVYVAGQTAIFQDFADVLTGKLPLFIGVVVGLAFILLMAVFRSLLVPLVASVMNLLAAGAGFGVVVAMFQWGWGSDLIGLSRTGPIAAFLPIMLFAILFGLSMDYEVFLVSRMHEEWLRTKDNDEAIALGQAETGRVITAAAAIMVFVFGSFVMGDNNVIKLFGIGLASAIALDALIIRTFLVPSVMHVLGTGNWYLPAWLDRVLPKLSVEPSTVHQAEAKVEA